MNWVAVLSLLVAVVGAVSAFKLEGVVNAELNEAWQEYKIAHRKSYGSGTEMIRRLIWEANLKSIQRHNLEYDMGRHTYTLGVNAFSDLTFEEFHASHLCLGLSVGNSNASAGVFMAPLNMKDLPDTVDWRTKGYVTLVKNQGKCGSCWAFSTTGAMEGQYFRKTQELKSFSEQQLMDCSRRYGNNGCQGGLMTRAFKYVQDKGLELEGDYTYKAADETCKFDAAKVVTKCSGHTVIAKGHEDDLRNAVATVGPISVAIDATHPSFQHYKQGVYNEPTCSATHLNHGVLAVGYGSEDSADYWLVKNSWGAGWGDNGYIKMSRNKHNQCGIATDASYPSI